MMDSAVSVEDRITNDLEKTEEVVFTAIALNPDAEAEKLRKKYGLKSSKMSSVIDSLLEGGLVELASQEDDTVWRVTELGRVLLMKYSSVLRFDVMEAELRGENLNEVEKLKQKKRFVDEAYRQSKVLFE